VCAYKELSGGESPNGVQSANFHQDKAKPVKLRTVCGQNDLNRKSRVMGREACRSVSVKRIWEIPAYT
jgi:hypothetical protein